VTHLRKMMLEELPRRNYAKTTIDCYLRSVEDFSRRFHCSPDRLGPRHIREYQAEMFRRRQFSPNTVAQRLAALRFFYTKTLKRTWSIEQTPYPKKTVHPANSSQPGRSCAAHRCGSASLASHFADGALRHRTPACRTRAAESPRHGQSAHCDSRPRRQRPQRSGCVAPSQVTRRTSATLAPIARKAQCLVVS
jgi:hypothetical protein